MKMPDSNVATLNILGMVCLRLAVKLDENKETKGRFLWAIDQPIPQMVEFGEYFITKQHLLEVELLLLRFLEWQPMVPTASEIVSLLLYIANDEIDFRALKEKVDDTILICLTLPQAETQAATALGALWVVLEELNFQKFA